MTSNDSRQYEAETSILIIGSGFAGIGLGIRLLQAGVEDFTILERADDVGGTWRDNVYPGVACDVPSHLYCFSFLLNPRWSRVFSPGREIQDYLRRCAQEAGLLSHIRFGAEMLRAQWDDAEQRWVVETPEGQWRARYLVTAAGHLADEHMPAVPGLNGFSGTAFHSARWNQDALLDGKRVGVVGSGASAIQIVPEVAKVAGELVVFQRSAPYIAPRPDRAYSNAEKRLFERDEDAMRSVREDIFWGAEAKFAQRRGISPFLEEARAAALAHLAGQVADEGLRARLTPDYELGCKRVLSSNDYYPTFCQSHVTLEASALQSVEGDRVIAASGRHYPLDVLIFATGFEATQPPFAERVHGRGGASLAERWAQGMEAYRSITVAGFPSLFIINGPNTGLGHNSAVYVIEAQIDYILGALEHARAARWHSIEVRRDAEAAYVERLTVDSGGTVWLDGGCESWYVDPRTRRLTLLWPDFAYSFRDRNGVFSADAYAPAAWQSS